MNLTQLRDLLLWTSLAAGIALAAWLRLEWIEPVATAHRCLAGLDSAGCLARRLAVAAFGSGGLRLVALGSALLALVWRHPLGAWLAALAGGVAMVLYSPGIGAAALLVGCLRLVRATFVTGGVPGGEDGRRQQHVA